MNKFYGLIGFSIMKKTAPGVIRPSITTRPYKGDVITNSRRYESRSDSTNSNLLVNNKISILSDDFIDKNIGQIIFVQWNSTNWCVTNAEINYPRIILTLGGVYNGDGTT